MSKIINKDGYDWEEKTVKTKKQTATILKRLETQEEIEAKDAVKAKLTRITELKELISNKKLLDMDVTAEQAELKDLLGL